MKKLLNILASLSLFTISLTTTISCNTKKNEEVPSEDPKNDNDYSKIIEEFKLDVNKIITKELMKTNDKMFELTKNEGLNKFLNQKKHRNFYW